MFSFIKQNIRGHIRNCARWRHHLACRNDVRPPLKSDKWINSSSFDNLECS